MTQSPRLGRRGVATTVGLVTGALAYVLSLLDYRTDLTRQANALGYASNFFDLQGRALLGGHLYVPRGSLGIEGFVEHGREYMYFPPFPALIRLPVLFVTHEYDGRLTLLSMALAFVVLAVMATRLVWLVRDLLLGDEPVSRGETAWMAVLLALVTGGTTLTAVAALPWVYHEVYAWAVALAIGAMYWMLRVWQQPTTTAICWLGGFDVALILTRTTGGWAMGLTTIALGLVLAWRARAVRPRRPRLPWAVVAVGAVAMAAGIAVNWAKFRHPYLFPLGDQVWTEVNEHRREALAAGHGTITGPRYFPTAFMAYFRLDGVRFVDYFPWITLPARPAPAYGDAVIDQSYRTGSVTAMMPWLLATTVLAVPVLWRRRADRAVRGLWFPFVAAVLLTGGVMAYGYIANRYTAEFVPALVLGGSIGTIGLAAWLRRHGPVLRRLALAVLVAATGYSVATQMLVGHASAATTSGTGLADYVALQGRLSPEAQARLVVRSPELPSGGRTDQLWVRGDCDALYLQTGDAYEPWALVEQRSVQVEASFGPRAEAARFPVLRVMTDEPTTVWLEFDGRGRARVDLVAGTLTQHGYWFDLIDQRTVRIGVRNLPGYNFGVVNATPGGGIGYVRTSEWDEDWSQRLAPILPLPRTVARDIDVRAHEGLAPRVCTSLVARSTAR